MLQFKDRLYALSIHFGLEGEQLTVKNALAYYDTELKGFRAKNPETCTRDSNLFKPLSPS